MAVFGAMILCLLLFASMLALLEGGFRLGLRFEQARGGEETSIFDGAIFALLGLLLGFAFAGSFDRLNLRRDLIVQEANAIGTAYMRIDLLSEQDQTALRPLFKRYLTERIEVYREIDADTDPEAALARVEELQAEIWRTTIGAISRSNIPNASEVVLPAINDMIDITTERKVALGTHIPNLVLGLLVGVSLFSALLAGVAVSRHGKRPLLHSAVFAAAVSLTIYTIMDLDNPRSGLIRVEAADRILFDLARSM